MGKIKSLALLLLGAIAAVFLYENWVPAPVIKIFGKELIILSNSLIIIICFLLGFLVGGLLSWAWWRRRARLQASKTQEAPEAQGGQRQEEQSQSQS